MSEIVLYPGGQLKAMGDGKVGGYGCYFTSELAPDLDGDFFTAHTNFELEDRIALPLYYGHGTDPTMQKQKLGKASFKQDGQGVWVQTQLDLHDKWLEKIYELVQQGKLSYSSGAISHLVERVKKGAANWLKTWPIGEISFTPSPAAPFGTEVKPLKSYSGPSLKEMLRHSNSGGTVSAVEVAKLRSASLGLRIHAYKTLYGAMDQTPLQLRRESSRLRAKVLRRLYNL